ncbi:hypothetical protein [Bradyrhizobium sp. AUGA SZCCT0431]|uniref:hypothetical protein n=1 Tax=Bradyrhizobium sp. AUGA SZCCT0431 TaxID=2807674 RepID=UPI001BA70D78|nr:hypothetical protein [Bradyrhizobium sp. AUGA SZCCT0431]MBR1148017.1 hypothetical protein [Bradyrhizobium sp. AUGA SZCCT0431]
MRRRHAGKSRTFIIVALLLLAACVAPVLWNYPKLYARVLEDRRFPALSRYALEPVPDVALVGSSMMFRIYEGYFSTRLRNVAIGGGSPLTGLAIIASYPKLPRVIVVETNILSRPVDATLVENFGNNAAEPFAWFWPYRVAISWVYYWLKYKSESHNVATLPQQPPSSYEIKTSLDEAEAEYANPAYDATMAANAATLQRLVAQLESRGVQIYFVELPYPGNLGQSRYAITARTLARTAFADRSRWPDINYHLSELRWVDASHMDERSAIIVAREIDGFLGRLTAAKAPSQVCVRHTPRANCRSLNPGELAHDQAARREQNVRMADSDFDRRRCCCSGSLISSACLSS